MEIKIGSAGSSAVDDRFHLQRFVVAQDRFLEQVYAELRNGQKRTHWMWFIFPQIAGLGASSTARTYAISGRAEALAYLAHPVLGQRLRSCTELVNAIDGRDVSDIFGYPDDLKFRSSMTLFAAVAPREPLFGAALGRYFRGEPDSATLQLLASAH